MSAVELGQQHLSPALSASSPRGRMRTDAEGHVGIQLEHRQIRKSAAEAIASTLRRLGPRVLPMSEMVRLMPVLTLP